MLRLLTLLHHFIHRTRLILHDRQFKGLLLLVLFILAVGTLFYSRVEHWSLLDALYFCVITLTTVGYGDLTPKTSLGKAFTMIYLVIGVGIILAFVNLVAKRATRQYLRHSETYLEHSEKFIETVTKHTLEKEQHDLAEHAKA